MREKGQDPTRLPSKADVQGKVDGESFGEGLTKGVTKGLTKGLTKGSTKAQELRFFESEGLSVMLQSASTNVLKGMKVGFKTL